MDDRRLDDILHRLEDIERYLESHSAWHQDDHERRGEGGCHCRCHERHHGHHRGHGQHEQGGRDEGPRGGRDEGRRSEGFEEKRVVDLIVRLVAEKVDELFCRYEQRRAADVASPPAVDSPPPAGSDEG